MSTRYHQSGFTMIEILVSLLILLTGLIGLAGLQARSHQAEMESYQREQALVLVKDMVDRLNGNRKVASCYAITAAATGTPALGTGYTGVPACAAGTAEQNALAVADMQAWDTTLKGASEKNGGSQVGAMIGARGCVNYDATTELTSPTTGAVLPGTGLYTVSVAWQGMGTTAAPTSNKCGQNAYGDEKQRRVISLTLRVAALDGT